MNKVNHYRITKYNPNFRDNEGRYLKSDWTSMSDPVPMEEYLKIENKYAKTVIDCANLCGIKKLKITSIEDRHSQFKLSRTKTEIIYKDWGSIDTLIRLILREKLWAKLISTKSFYVHFGYDYYMYIGGSFELNTSKINGLYVEEFISPFLSKVYMKNDF